MPYGHGGFPLAGAEMSPSASPFDTPEPPTTVNPLALRLGDAPVAPGNSAPEELNTSEDNDITMDGHDIPVSNGTADNSESWSVSGKRANPLPISSLKSGLCYDVRMRYHATVDADDMHPEDPRRILEIYKAICMAGLVDDPGWSGVKKHDDLMERIDAREVTREEALLVHTAEHWQFLEFTTGGYPDKYTSWETHAAWAPYPGVGSRELLLTCSL